MNVRSHFPALEGGFAFLENAGGSQVPRQVIDRTRDLFLRGYVQTGAGYPSADFVDDVVAQAKSFANVLMNGDRVGLTVIGPSTTDLLYRLSNSLSVHDGDEIVIGVSNHESNIGPWVRLAERGAVVKWWGVDPATGEYDYSELQSLLTERTKIVAVAHTSNILGDILDARRVCEMGHAVGALAVVDGVANAPHAAVDVKSIGADFYALSMYKVFGPHIALLFGKHDAWSQVKGPNHYFISDDDLPWKFELGCQPYELLSGLLGVGDYLAAVTGRDVADRGTVEAAFATFAALERPVLERIGQYLLDNPCVRMVGPRTTDQLKRHPTFSFVHASLDSRQVVERVNGPDLGIRYGHMYAARLCKALDVSLTSGFVRVSAVHYNTTEEADRLLAALDQVL